MDVREIKLLLKQAREAIKDKEHKTALKHCKAILKSDNNNYNAWVFVGVAAQETDQPVQSEAAFKRAIDIAPDQILAWQGLCNFYEKQNKIENQTKLLAVYNNIIQLLNLDRSKRLEFIEKLIPIIKQLGDKKEIVHALELKLEAFKGEKESEHYVQKDIFEELIGEINLTEHQKHLQTNALQELLLQSTYTEDWYKRIISTCIEPLYKNGDENHALSLAQQIYEKYPNSSSCVEFLCRVALATYINKGILIDGIKQMSEKLKHCDSARGLSSVIEGLVLFISKKYLSAIQEFKEGLKTMECCLEAWYLLAKTQLIVHQYCHSEKSSKTGLHIAAKSKTPSNIVGSFYLILGQALSGMQNWDSAIKAFEKCVEHLGQSKEILRAFCLTLLKIEQIDKAEKICKELRTELGDGAEELQLEGYALFLRRQYPNALKKLRLSLSMTESSLTLHFIALVLWESEQQNKAFRVFIKAVELDPYFSKNFLYLGHYYAHHLFDKSKACLCYQRAFELDSTDCECGMSLTQVLKDLGKENENIRILKIITEQASLGSCKWAWTQLGLSQLENNNITEAIFSLQNAVRVDLNSRVSTIQKIRGIYLDAIEKYKNLLNIVPTYIPALIGLAETLVLLCKRSFIECLYGLARDCCQEALQVLAKAVVVNPGLSCLWKLAGDACTIPFNFDDKWYPISVPSELHQGSRTDVTSCQKPELLSFGSKFYGHALSLKENVSSLWHDIGVNYHFQSQLPNCGNKKDFAEKAFICFQKAITISPNHEAHWTAVAVVNIRKELNDHSFGQHALIKSLEINQNNAETWTNLGILYLENENIKLSHNAFKNAQSAEPTYPLSWIGQAFIAGQVKHSETLDLYRHATTLGSHTEALLGYARAVCEMLKNKDIGSYSYNIEQMNTVVAAMDCAQKFIANNSNCPEAFNILGMLLERQGIHMASLKAYERSLRLFESTILTEATENVRANYARILSVVGQTVEARKEFLVLKKIDATLLCSFALALHKEKQYEESLKTFKQALELSQNPGEKSHIIVAMAMVSMNLHGPEYPSPLTLLFESSQIQPASVPGLLALFSVGILKDEKSLAFAAEKELAPYKFHKDYISSLAFLCAAKAYMLNGTRAARNELLKAIHCQPDNASMWLQMAQCFLQWDRSYARIAGHCTKVGVFHSGQKELASQIFALCQMSLGYRKGALSAAQKAVHVNPETLSNWTTLAAACHVADKDREHIGWLFSFVKKLAKQQGIESDLLGWLVIMEAFHYICSENISSASALINQALSISSFSSETQSILQVLVAVIHVFSSNGRLDALVITMKKNPKSFLGWHILCQLLLGSRQFNEAEKTLSQFMVTTAKFFSKWAVFPLLQLVVLSYKAIYLNNDDNEKWRRIGEKAIKEAVRISPSSQAARFLEGVLAVESGSDSLARRSFERVISNSAIKEAKWMETAARQFLVSLYLKKKSNKNALQDLLDKFPCDEELKEFAKKLLAAES